MIPCVLKRAEKHPRRLFSPPCVRFHQFGKPEEKTGLRTWKRDLISCSLESRGTPSTYTYRVANSIVALPLSSFKLSLRSISDSGEGERRENQSTLEAPRSGHVQGIDRVSSRDSECEGVMGRELNDWVVVDEREVERGGDPTTLSNELMRAVVREVE